jgi:replication-associated recombination protein RarA
MTTANLPGKYRPASLDQIRGQPGIVQSLTAFAKSPASAAFVFAGGTGVGKSAMAQCLASALGCEVAEGEFGGLLEIPSGQQDGRAVDDLSSSLALIPLMGSGWRVAIINEADRMTEQAEAVWLDVLERLPPRCVICFTTNDLGRLSDRLLHRCEVFAFESDAKKLRPAIVQLAKQVWKAETGKALRSVPENLGVFDTFSGQASFRLALQQLAGLIRSGRPAPEAIAVPMMRTEDPFKAAARKAVETRRRKALTA